MVSFFGQEMRYANTDQIAEFCCDTASRRADHHGRLDKTRRHVPSTDSDPIQNQASSWSHAPSTSKPLENASSLSPVAINAWRSCAHTETKPCIGSMFKNKHQHQNNRFVLFTYAVSCSWLVRSLGGPPIPVTNVRTGEHSSILMLTAPLTLEDCITVRCHDTKNEKQKTCA